jgi:D-alanyl-D-alanine carboxypeptidase
MRVGFHMRTLRAISVICLVAAATTGAADAGPRFHRHKISAHSQKVSAPYSPPTASFVMDAHSGNILYAKNADARCHPASLTKVMTLYLLFEQLRAGKTTLNSRLPISWHAASQAPSRLGVKPGETIRVEDAILAIVTRSANDIAVALAEYLGGTEKNFAEQMTAKARALGMKETEYVNASGLPDRDQITSARDQAVLAQHIQSDFPQYFPYFSTEKFAWDGTFIKNHNHLLGKYEGVTGLKTGYTAASGFNLTTTVTRDNKSLIGVVLGGKTAQTRDKEMVAILDRSLPLAVGGGYNDGLSRTN